MRTFNNKINYKMKLKIIYIQNSRNCKKRNKNYKLRNYAKANRIIQSKSI